VIYFQSTYHGRSLLVGMPDELGLLCQPPPAHVVRRLLIFFVVLRIAYDAPSFVAATRIQLEPVTKLRKDSLHLRLGQPVSCGVPSSLLVPLAQVSCPLLPRLVAWPCHPSSVTSFAIAYYAFFISPYTRTIWSPLLWIIDLYSPNLEYMLVIDGMLEQLPFLIII